ncbi:hypothetical protein LCGC14_0957630 [marine sediment metagenome]|uniref:Uncharacterized protein n=1 Tax=marine sediment metagenome TaxID=412755 RepID=A0A0F9NFB6_9ZZZZ|nr:MAG: hypothetical protein Lokiarch_22620 [Candidatus Lokiarchaeum sp. GC14_75]HDZ18867.1 hypothetical protein [archaeon]
MVKVGFYYNKSWFFLFFIEFSLFVFILRISGGIIEILVFLRINLKELDLNLLRAQMPFIQGTRKGTRKGVILDLKTVKERWE